jgi:hypothetical protein
MLRWYRPPEILLTPGRESLGAFLERMCRIAGRQTMPQEQKCIVLRSIQHNALLDHASTVLRPGQQAALGFLRHTEQLMNGLSLLLVVFPHDRVQIGIASSQSIVPASQHMPQNNVLAHHIPLLR